MNTVLLLLTISFFSMRKNVSTEATKTNSVHPKIGYATKFQEGDGGTGGTIDVIDNTLDFDKMNASHTIIEHSRYKYFEERFKADSSTYSIHTLMWLLILTQLCIPTIFLHI